MPPLRMPTTRRDDRRDEGEDDYGDAGATPLFTGLYELIPEATTEPIRMPPPGRKPQPAKTVDAWRLGRGGVG